MWLQFSEKEKLTVEKEQILFKHQLKQWMSQFPWAGSYSLGTWTLC